MTLFSGKFDSNFRVWGVNGGWFRIQGKEKNGGGRECLVKHSEQGEESWAFLLYTWKKRKDGGISQLK